MARIRGKHTRPEVVLRKALRVAGVGYRLHAQTLAGRPDMVLPGRVAIFIDGCFWHGCPKHYVRPRSREAFWADKLLANFDRDHRQTRHLEKEGWRVFRVWEHEVFAALPRTMKRLRALSAGTVRSIGCGWRVVRAEGLLSGGKTERWTLRELRRPRRVKVIRRIRTTTKWLLKG